MASVIDNAIAAIAGRQQGLIATRRLLALSADDVQYRVTIGRLRTHRSKTLPAATSQSNYRGLASPKLRS